MNAKQKRKARRFIILTLANLEVIAVILGLIAFGILLGAKFSN